MASQLLYLFFLCVFSTTKAQSPHSNITIGSTLYTNTTPNFWPSPSGRFAFGFYPSGDGFKIGIWLVGVPKNTIVWTALRDGPLVSAGATLLLYNNGRLQLRSALGQVEHITDNAQGASNASMLDSGNFVLYDSDFNAVWASFHYPTDTLLVGQRLVQNAFLYSSTSKSDYSTGRFMLAMQKDNNLVAYPLRNLQLGRYSYWYTSTANKGYTNVSLNLDEDGRLYLGNSSGITVKNLNMDRFPADKAFVFRTTFDVDGILRLYLHQIGMNGSLNSSVVWKGIKDEDRCLVKGICGLNSYCAIDGANLNCLCPPGFDFVDPDKTSGGCKVNFNPENDCIVGKVSMNYSMQTLVNAAWEDDAYENLQPSSEEVCLQACLEDCHCVVAMFREEMCLKLKLPMRFGKKKAIVATRTFVKIRSRSSSADPPPGGVVVINKITKRLGKEFLIAGLVLATFSMIIFVFSGYLIYTYKIWSSKFISKQSSPSDFDEEINLRSFAYNELVEATDNFKEELGKGASGRVYKGSLPNNEGREIAVKKLEKVMEEGEREFQNEMKVIGRTHHKNLVRLLGFCSEGSNRLLVYEYMKNGSLGDLLFKARTRRGWDERVRISLEIARGIVYLHEECEPRIIHCDIKPHNILMDQSWSARISDFGLSKLLKPDQTRTYTTPRGTRGYAAPEWHKNTLITVKADVYSYGILLFEIICCRKKIDISLVDDEIILLDWVYSCYDDGELGKLVGGEEVEAEALERMVKVGLWCVQTEPSLRPSMKKVVLMLEGTVMTPPPPPFSSVNA
ncbi:hypothetical protein HHK36_004221 [Tetracentron sinense]|uniref:Receptor-like serine/threonine-protein kinase n=1 Tax=Tetracentron sinense TaxID=13715 RepID=A0A834YBJ1_TETSI|nr:hypothetical protein HHK36_031590 [Tetracentron sinense]KAF8411663.1 hypothetical protein HHK36_004221 [Tetracentron sinense]